MHELAITQSMFDIILKQAKEVNAKKVTKINLVIGEMTGVVSDCVQFYLDFLSKDTVAEGAMVSVIMMPAQGQCHSCKQKFDLKEFDWTCPKCHGSNIDIIAGKELFLKSIEVD